MNQLNIHPFCAVFPEATTEEFHQLKASIDKRGQIDPIVLLGGEVLDGRNRYQACRELKIPPQFRQYDPVKDGKDPLQWVIDKNLNRRHLTVGQRSALAVDLTKLAKEAAETAKEAETPTASPTPNGPEDHPEDLPDFLQKKQAAPDTGHAELTQEQAAAAMGVSPRSVGDATFLAKNDPERFEAVKAGKTSLNAATEAAKKDADSGQSQLGTKGTIPNQYRTECADMLAASHGDKFAEAIRNDTILKDQELRAFMKLPVQDQKQITGLVSRGWKVREAVKFSKGIFEKDDPIRDILNLAIMRDGKAVTTLDGHTILIIADELLAQSSMAADIAAILEAQRKPETTAPKVDNSLGKAMESAKPGKSKPGKPSADTTESTGAADAPSAAATPAANSTGKAKRLTPKEKAALIERQGKRELFLVSVEKAPKKNRVKMVLDYWRDNGDEEAEFLMEYPTLTHTPDPLIVATLEEIKASIKRVK